MQTEHLIQSLKAGIIGTLISVVFALIFAFIVRFFPIGETALLVTVQSLKALSLVLACLFVLNADGGWKKGILAGIVFTLLTYLSFSAIGGEFVWSWKWLFDLGLGVAVGVLSGIAAVNLKRSL